MTKEEILHAKFGDNIDQLLPPFPAVKDCIQTFADQEVSEYKRKLIDAVQTKAEYNLLWSGDDAIDLPEIIELIDAIK